MNQKSLFKKFRESQVFWPLVAWVIILAVDAISPQQSKHPQGCRVGLGPYA